MRRSAEQKVNCFTISDVVKEGLLRTRHEDGEVFVLVGFGDGAVRVPVSNAQQEAVLRALEQGIYKKLPALKCAEAADTRLGVRLMQAIQPFRALVHVETSAGVGGELQYMATSYGEELINDRVTRHYRQFPPPGVLPLVQAPGCDVGEQQMLVQMWPGASFRLFRTGKVDSAPRGFTVHWNGYKLRMNEFGAARRSAAA